MKQEPAHTRERQREATTPMKQQLVHLRRGQHKNTHYTPWPRYSLDFQDTVSGALQCLDEYVARTKTGRGLWIPPWMAAEYAGLSATLVRNRCRASVLGDEGAWPWTRVENRKGSIVLPIDELWEEVQWVCPAHVPPYLGVKQRAISKAIKEGRLISTHRDFRGTWKNTTCILLPSVVEYKWLLKLAGIFGERQSYEVLEMLLDIPAITVARLSLSKVKLKGNKDDG